jgi:RNAse (barnase) inhibitor barstar
MSTIQAALTGSRPSGVYRFVSRAKPDTLRRAVERAGWRFFHLDGHQIQDKRSFLQSSATAINFPSYFGHNWDAFNDSINDIAWAPGFVILYDQPAHFATAHPNEWQTAQEIFQEAVDRWGKTGASFYVLLRGSGVDAPIL